MPAAPSATDLVVSVLRFKWTLLTISILVSAPIIAAIWTQIVPQYEARAEIRVRPIIPRLVFRTDENGAIPFYESFVNTQVSLIRNREVLERVLDTQEVQTTQWYKSPPKTLLPQLRGNETPPLERLRDSLSVRPRPRTEIIDVSFADVSAKDDRIIVDAVLDQYMKYYTDASGAMDDKLHRQLVDQYKSLENEIQGREKILTELHKSLGTETPQELVAGRRIRLDETQARLGDLRSRMAVLEWEIKRTEPNDSNGVSVASADGTQNKPRYHLDEEWRRLDLEVRTIQHQMANTILGPNHPDRARLTRNLEFAEESRGLREKQLDEQWGDRLRNAAGLVATATGEGTPGYGEGALSLKHQLARAKVEEQRLRADLEEQQKDFKDLFDTAQLLEKENTGLRNKRELFDAVRQRLDQKTVERNVAGSIEIAMKAFSSSTPASDRRVVFTAMALFAGLGLGGGVAFLRAGRNQTIYAPKDMPQPAQAPFLGHIPLVRFKKLGGSLGEEVEQKQLLLIESVRVLRTALLSRLRGQGRTAVVVTSANEGTGKSSFTMVLGKSIAQAGRRVLIIDADLHKMTLSKRLAVLDKPGLRESLKDKAAGELHVFPTETAGLDVMPAGNRSNGDVVFEEIANGAFRSCIGRLFEQYGYDIILLDTPPLLPVADAAILAGQVDGAILVEREHVSRRTEIANALLRLGATGGRLLGTVFVGSVEQDHYGYAYSYSHYGSKTREP
jgi:capsular exopolysaccharide synthesis family protein